MKRRGFLSLLGIGAAGAAGGLIPAAAKAAPLVGERGPELIAPTLIDGGLIVSGAITAKHIAAGSIIAAKIDSLSVRDLLIREGGAA